MTLRRLAAAALAVAALGTVGACSSAGPAPDRTGRVTPSAPSSAAPESGTSPAAASSSATPATAPASATASASSAPAAAASGATSGAPRSTCRSLMVRVIRGSAAPGFEFAALQFVNTGSTRCVLYGYPQVRLLRGGTVIGSPAAPADATPSRFTLAPGAVAESRLKDYSSCQASLSDEIQVVAPTSTIGVTRPGQLRACRLRVSSLSTPE